MRRRRSQSRRATQLRILIIRHDWGATSRTTGPELPAIFSGRPLVSVRVGHGTNKPVLGLTIAAIVAVQLPRCPEAVDTAHTIPPQIGLYAANLGRRVLIRVGV